MTIVNYDTPPLLPFFVFIEKRLGQHWLERFICVFGINPAPQVIDKLFKELILFTVRAA